MATLGSMLDWSAILDALEEEAEELEQEAAAAEQEADYAEMQQEWSESVYTAREEEQEEEEYPSDAEFLASALEDLSTALLYGNWEQADEIATTLEDVTGALNSFEIDIVETSLTAYYDALESYTNPVEEEPQIEEEPQEGPTLTPFDLVSEVGYLHELAQDQDIDRQDFEQLAGELYDHILSLSDSDPLLANSLWDDLTSVESYMRGETLGIGWDAEGAAVFSYEERSNFEDYRTRGTFASEYDAQAWIAEIGVDAFVIVETDEGFEVIEIGTGGGKE